MSQEIYFGYREKKGNPFELIAEKDPCCMIKMVDPEGLRDLIPLGINAFIGQWLITTGSCQTGINYEGPFNTMGEAFNCARIKFGAIRIISIPEWNN